MDNVLPFSREGRRSRSNGAAQSPPSAEGADILLFTGVRYERHDDAPPLAGRSGADRDDSPSTPPRRKSRRRA